MFLHSLLYPVGLLVLSRAKLIIVPRPGAGCNCSGGIQEVFESK